MHYMNPEYEHYIITTMNNVIKDWVSGCAIPTRPNKTMELEAKSMKNSNMFHISASNEIEPNARITVLAAISPGRTFPLPGTLLSGNIWHPGPHKQARMCLTLTSIGSGGCEWAHIIVAVQMFGFETWGVGWNRQIYCLNCHRSSSVSQRGITTCKTSGGAIVVRLLPSPLRLIWLAPPCKYAGVFVIKASSASSTRV